MRKTRARHNGTRTQLQPEGELLSILMGSRHAQDIDSNRGFPKLQLMTATDHRELKAYMVECTTLRKLTFTENRTFSVLEGSEAQQKLS